MTINLYLTGANPNKRGLQLRYLDGKNKIFISLKIVFDQKYWDEKKQRFKSNWIGANDSNCFINKIIAEIETTHLKLKAENKVLNKEILTNIIFPSQQTVVSDDLLIPLIEQFVEVIKPQRVKVTIYKYIKLISELKEFQTSCSKVFYLSSFAVNDLNLWVNYLLKKNISNVTIFKKIENFLSFLSYAENRNLEFDIKLKLFKPNLKAPRHKKDCLTIEQLKELYNFKVTETEQFQQRKNVYSDVKFGILEKVKDLFCFSCFTGLRVSDLNSFSSNDIKDGCLEFVIKKTKNKIKIKLPEGAISILKKYNYVLPKIAAQNINEYIKKVCQQMGWDTPTKISKMIGAKEVIIEKPFYEIVSIHMARRTFITLSMTHFGINPAIVQAIAGHQDIKTTMGYTSIKQNDMNSAMDKWTI